MHAGYLRHYAEPLRLLAERGHTIQIALGRSDKDPVDRILVDRLIEGNPNVTVRFGPERSYVDGWRRIAWLVRGLADIARYAHPRYAHATTLRARMHTRVVARIHSSAMEPISKLIVTRLATRVAAAEGAEAAARNGALFARLEEAIPASRRHLALFRSWRPDVVLASPVVEIASPQVEFVKAAQRLGIPTGVCVASWDNLTNKGLLRVLPDRVVVWNEIQRTEAVELHGVDPADVIVTGAQRFDEWFERTPSTTAAEFAAATGLPANRPYVLFLGSSLFIAPDEVSFVRRWVAALRDSGRPELESVGVLIRPHPQNGTQWVGFEPPDDGVVVWPPAGAQPDAGEAREVFFDSLAHSAAVVGINTSALIEAGILGKSVFTPLDPQFQGTQEGTLHFHYLLKESGGFLEVARDLETHVEQLAAGVAGRETDAAQTRAFVESFVRPHGFGQPAAVAVADAIEEIAAIGRREPTPRRLRTFLTRGALLPFVLGNGAVATVIFAARHLGLRARDADRDESGP